MRQAKQNATETYKQGVLQLLPGCVEVSNGRTLWIQNAEGICLTRAYRCTRAARLCAWRSAFEFVEREEQKRLQAARPITARLSITDAATVLRNAASDGQVLITKVCNAPVNLGKAPELVLAEQLSALGFVLAEVQQ